MNKNNDFVVFSSSRDTEESLATPNGSLFTSAVTEVFSNPSLKSKPLNEISSIVSNKVLQYAKETDGIPHHPTINYSNPSIGSKSLQGFVSSKGVPATMSPSNHSNVQNTFESMLSSGKFKTFSIHSAKHNYREGDSVEFAIDTQGANGYLTLFYIDKSDVTILYPNPFVRASRLQGKYDFPRDLANGKFELEAYKSCNGCQEEKTTVYALLSSEPVTDINTLQSKGLKSFGNNSNESKVISRAIRVKSVNASNSSFTPQLGKYEFIVK